MNERLTIQDLTDLLAAKHSMTKKDAEAFVKEFFLLIEQALESEKTVKIKGLGTFKLIDVDSRKSVNVNTGERFQIKGHTKVSFSPDANLRDTINKPFAHFETVLLNENTILEDTPIEEPEEEEVNIVQEEQITEQPIETETVVEEPIVVEAINIEVMVEQQPEELPLTEADSEKGVEQEPIEEEIPIVEQRQLPEQPIKETERITAEQIIEQELLKANLKPETPVVLPEKENVNLSESAQTTTAPDSKKKTPAKEKSPVPYLITIIILVLLRCYSIHLLSGYVLFFTR